MEPLINLYETFGLAALFLLFVEYVAPDENTRLDYFGTLENRKPKNQFLPHKGYTVVPGGSQEWYQRKIVFVFLYVIVDILCTILELVTEAVGTYCEASWNPKYFHIWDEVITNIFLALALTSIVLFYYRFNKEPEFAQHKPGLKLISFKLIVFITFAQRYVFSRTGWCSGVWDETPRQTFPSFRTDNQTVSSSASSVTASVLPINSPARI